MKKLERELAMYELYMDGLEKIEDYHAWKNDGKAHAMECADELQKYFDVKVNVVVGDFGKSMWFHPSEAANKDLESFRMWLAEDDGKGELYGREGLLGEVYDRKKELSVKLNDLRDMVENYEKYLEMNREFTKAYYKYKAKVPERMRAFTIKSTHQDFVSEL